MKVEQQNTQTFTVKEIKELFYDCQFKDALTKIESALSQESQLSILHQLINLKAKIEFELNKREDAMKTLEIGQSLFHFKENEDSLYALGSLQYFQGKFDKALASFEKMQDFNLSPDKSFLSLLSIGNVYYSQKEWAKAQALISELANYSDNVPFEYKLSLILLEANILAGSNSNLKLAQEKYEYVYTEALRKRWSYFSLRSQYYLSKLLIKNQDVDMAKGMLKILDLNLKTLDWRFLATLVNNEFNNINFKSTQAVSIESESMSLTIGCEDQYTVSLARWPQLFKLTKLLFDQKDYVSKEAISTALWPEQKYLPKTHDPRIYDLVARLKKHLEVSSDISLLVVAANGGYKLSA